MATVPYKTFTDLRGNVCTLRTLEEMKGAARWSAGKKFIVVQGIEREIISRQEAMDWYSLTEEELNRWVSNYHERGPQGLQIARSVGNFREEQKRERKRKFFEIYGTETPTRKQRKQYEVEKRQRDIRDMLALREEFK